MKTNEMTMNADSQLPTAVPPAAPVVAPPPPAAAPVVAVTPSQPAPVAAKSRKGGKKNKSPVVVAKA